MIFLVAYLYVHYLIILSLVMCTHIKLMNTFGNWLFIFIVKVLCCSVSATADEKPDTSVLDVSFAGY